MNNKVGFFAPRTPTNRFVMLDRFDQRNRLAGFSFSPFFAWFSRVVGFAAWFAAFALFVLTPPAWALAAETLADKNSPALHTHLTIDSQGTILVTQIFTNFPNDFRFYFRNSYTSNAPFALDNDLPQSVQLKIDGKKVTANISDSQKDPYIRLHTDAPGEHNYVLTYKTSKRILFEGEHDKLVWGLWGGPVPEKIASKFSASVELPAGGVFQQYDAHLGAETLASRPITKMISSKGWAMFGSKFLTPPDEDMVLTVTWNKGVVTPDDSANIIFFFSVAMSLALCLVVLGCGLLWYRYGRDPLPKATTALFYPPLYQNRLLSPAAVNYLRHAAHLTSRGFAATLLNLAAQKALTIIGKGTNKEPYILVQTSPITLTDQDEKGREPRKLWNTLLNAHKGFDVTERTVINSLFFAKGRPLLKDVLNKSKRPHSDQTQQAIDNQDQPCLVMNRKHSWELASARSDAYMALAGELRSLWCLRADVVSWMHLLAYGLMAFVLGIFFWFYGSGASWASALTAMVFTAALSFMWHKINSRVQRTLMVWEEIGWINLLLYVLYLCLIQLHIVYDLIMDEGFATFPGYVWMQSWADLRAFLILSLAGYLFWLTRQWRIVFWSPFVTMGICCAFAIPFFAIFYMPMPWLGTILFLVALLVPTLLTPLMKQPTQKCADILADIEGFALYLGAAEVNRFAVIDPPEKTPEEFLRGLPYAVALGMDKAWGAQFANLTGKLELQGSTIANMAAYNHRLSGQ